MNLHAEADNSCIMKISPIAKALIAFTAIVGVAAPVHASPLPEQKEYMLLASAASADQMSTLVSLAGGSVKEKYAGTGIMSVSLSDASAASLRALGVTVSERNTSGFSNTAKPDISVLRGLDRIDEEAIPLDYSFAPPSSENGTGVNIYVVDSGVVGTHEAFGGRVQTGVAFVNTPANVGLNGTGPGNVDTCDGHGTHVAGIAAGAGIGVAPGATIIPVRVFGCDPVTNSKLTLSPQQQEADLLLAFQWINNHHQPGQRAVVNLSLGGDYKDDSGRIMTSPIDALIAQGQAEGIAYVGAAGNDNKDSCDSWPSAVPGVLGVGAFSMYQDTEERSTFSNYGACVDISAPGGQADIARTMSLEAIVSAWPFAANGAASTTSYAYSAGTSQASPFVAGAVARYMSANSTHTANQSLQAIYDKGLMNKLSSATLLGTPNRILYVPKTGFKVTTTPTPTPTPTTPVTPTPTPTVTPTPTPTPTPTVTPGARPSAPAVTGVQTAKSKATLTWMAPAGVAPAAIVRYEIRWTTKTGISSWSSWKTVKAGPTASYTITKLPSRSTRYAQVRAVTSTAVSQPATIKVRTR